MARHVWSVLCRKAVIDKETNQASLFEVLEAIKLSGELPQEGTSFRCPLSFVTLWQRSDLNVSEEPQTCRAKLIVPTGQSFPTPEGTLNLVAARRSRWILRVDGIPFYGAGLYEFAIERKLTNGDWVTDASVPLDVEVETAITPSDATSARQGEV